MKTLLVRAAVAGAVLVAAAACTSPVEVTQTDFTGRVELVESTANGVRVLLRDVAPASIVPAIHAADDPAMKKIVLLTAETRLYVKTDDGALRPGSAADLAVDALLSVKHDGTEMRSLPPQYHAVWAVVR